MLLTRRVHPLPLPGWHSRPPFAVSNTIALLSVLDSSLIRLAKYKLYEQKHPSIVIPPPPKHTHYNTSVCMCMYSSIKLAALCSLLIREHYKCTHTHTRTHTPHTRTHAHARTHTGWILSTLFCQPGGTWWDCGDTPSGRSYSGPAAQGEGLLLWLTLFICHL